MCGGGIVLKCPCTDRWWAKTAAVKQKWELSRSHSNISHWEHQAPGVKAKTPVFTAASKTRGRETEIKGERTIYRETNLAQSSQKPGHTNSPHPPPPFQSSSSTLLSVQWERVWFGSPIAPPTAKPLIPPSLFPPVLLGDLAGCSGGLYVMWCDVSWCGAYLYL